MLPYPLMDSAQRDLRMAAARRRFEAAKNLVGYEASRSMSPPRLQLSDGGDYVVVEWRRREPEEGRGMRELTDFEESRFDVPCFTSHALTMARWWLRIEIEVAWDGWGKHLKSRGLC